ncbi:hypothetical protein QFZ98_001469 [Paraburkholderia youngii]
MLSSNARGQLCSQASIGRTDSARSLEASSPTLTSSPLRRLLDYSRPDKTSGGNLRRVALPAECLANIPPDVLMLNGRRSRDREADLFSLAWREAERVWLDERGNRRPCILKTTQSESLDAALRRLAYRVPASDARVIGLDAPDQDCQNMFSVAVLIATIVACGGSVICAVDPRIKRTRVLKFALASCGLRLEQITVDDRLQKYMVDRPEIRGSKSSETKRKSAVSNQATSQACGLRVRLFLDCLRSQRRSLDSDVWGDAPAPGINASVTSRLRKMKHGKTREECCERRGGAGVQGSHAACVADREAQRAACAAAYRNEFALARLAKERRLR